MSESSLPINPKQKRLTDAEWAEACALWETGEFRLDDLSAKYGVTRESLSRGLSKRGAIKGASASDHAARVAEEVKKAAQEDAAVLAKRIRETKENSYEWIMALTRMTMNEVVSAAKRKEAVGTKLNNLKALERAMKTVALGSAEMYRILGLDKNDVDESELPELTIAEMTADEIIQVRQAVKDPLMAATDISDLDEDAEVVEEGDYDLDEEEVEE